MTTPLRVIAKTLVRYERIRRIVDAEYECTGDKRMVVRRDDVAEFVALKLREVLSPNLRMDIAAAVVVMGFEGVMNGNRALYRRVKRKGTPDADAIANSAEIRSATQGTARARKTSVVRATPGRGVR